MRATAWMQTFFLVGFAATPLVLTAQHGADSPSLITKAPKEAAQYDFLLGEWSLSVKQKAVGLAQKMHGVPALRGNWKATRALDGWGIEDDLHITDQSGNPMALSHFVRVYDAAAKHWVVAAIDAYRANVTNSTAVWKENGMESESNGTDAEGNAFISRVRISAITPTSFKYQQDRSFDGGKTWDEGFLTIDAKRTAAAGR